MDMIRATATVLVMALSLALGHMPCRMVPGHECEAACCGGEASGPDRNAPATPCCPHCSRERGASDRSSAESGASARTPVRAHACDCPKIAGVLMLAAGIDFAPATLPERGMHPETARCPTSVVEIAPVPRAPPRSGRSLPLLL
jgi:hypothetical protein